MNWQAWAWMAGAAAVAVTMFSAFVVAVALVVRYLAFLWCAGFGC